MRTIAMFTLILLMPLFSYAKKVKTLRIRENKVLTTFVSPRGAVVNFPSKPTKVVLGSKGDFAIEYINSDLAISPLKNHARANLFVYLGQRRFNLDLISRKSGYTLILIRDSEDKKMEIPYGK